MDENLRPERIKLEALSLATAALLAVILHERRNATEDLDWPAFALSMAREAVASHLDAPQAHRRLDAALSGEVGKFLDQVAMLLPAEADAEEHGK